jgi:putative hydrolase of the HAD superfamily
MIRVSGVDIEAVLFDLDNTLVDRDQAIISLANQLAKSVDWEESRLSEAKFVQGFIRIDAEGSVPDRRAQMSSVIDELLIVDADPDGLKNWWDREYPAAFTLEESTKQILQKLADTNTPWGIVTNGSPLQSEVITAVGLDQAAKSIFVSSIVGLRKPDKAIFELAASSVSPGTELNNILFVGDNPVADIEGAAAAGMTTVWVSRGSVWLGVGENPGDTIENVGELSRLIGSD